MLTVCSQKGLRRQVDVGERAQHNLPVRLVPVERQCDQLRCGGGDSSGSFCERPYAISSKPVVEAATLTVSCALVASCSTGLSRSASSEE